MSRTRSCGVWSWVNACGDSCAPFRGSARFPSPFPRLTPWANFFRPDGLPRRKRLGFLFLEVVDQLLKCVGIAAVEELVGGIPLGSFAPADAGVGQARGSVG